MSTLMSELYRHAREPYRLQLMGGEKGLRNAVQWVYLSEDIRNVSFLKGGELAITTGLFTQSGVTLLAFVRALAVHGSSGLILNTGRYLRPSDVTAEIRDFCDQCGFPLLTMPWDVHLVDVMQDLTLLLMENLQSTETLNATLQNALHQEPVQEHALRLAERYGFPTQAAYRLVLIQNMQSTAPVTRELNGCGLHYHLFPHETWWAMLYQVPEGQSAARDVAEILSYCDSIRLGFSDVLPTLCDLGKGYRQARFAMAAAVYRRRRAVRFEDLGLLQILFYTADTQRLMNMEKRSLGALEQYDLAHHAEFLDTLQAYLACGGVLETARQLHAHRNTVVYRLKRIREILNVDLESPCVKYDLQQAFEIREFFCIGK